MLDDRYIHLARKAVSESGLPTKKRLFEKVYSKLEEFVRNYGTPKEVMRAMLPSDMRDFDSRLVWNHSLLPSQRAFVRRYRLIGGAADGLDRVFGCPPNEIARADGWDPELEESLDSLAGEIVASLESDIRKLLTDSKKGGKK
jgi:hypothetical protein